ncbi:MAG: hypothetical protein ACLPXZ_02520 [Mycobacterium sp.]
MATVSSAIGAVIGAYRPGIHQRAVTVEEVHLPGVEGQTAVAAVQGHRLLWKTSYVANVLYHGTESRHRAGSKVVNLDRAGRIRNTGLDGYFGRIH